MKPSSKDVSSVSIKNRREFSQGGRLDDDRQERDAVLSVWGSPYLNT